MVVSCRISGAITALVIAVAACADGRDALIAPAAPAALPSSSAALKAMVASSNAIDDESARLAAMVENSEQRARLTASLDRLSRAMEAGDLPGARRALSSARDGLRFVQSDADRDALRLALDAADESLSATLKHGAIR